MRSHAKAVIAGLTLLACLILGVTLASATAPTVTIDAPSAVEFNSAHVSGTVDPADQDTSGCRFDYVTEAQFGVDGFTSANQAGCDVLPGQGSGATPVQADLGGLEDDTDYRVRLVADNVDGQDVSGERTFRTLAVTAPVVTIDTPSAAFTTASLSGSVDPEGTDDAFNASCRFDYVTDDQFGIDGFDSANQIGCDTDPVTGSDPVAVRADLSGLAHSTRYHARLVSSNLGGQSASSTETFTTGTVIAPSVAIDPVSSITGTTAHFAGTVNPNAPGDADDATQDPAFDANWSFTCDPGCSNGTRGGTVLADDDANPVSENPTHLQPNTDYTVTLRASNLGGEDTDQVSFRTEPAAPSVQITNASFPSSTQTQLNGFVDPRNSPTTYWFEWGTRDCSANPCTAVPARRDADAGSTGNRFVSQQVSGLTPGATYHYRLLADNGTGGAIASENVTFTAFLPDPACTNPGFPGVGFLPNCRGWEMVSPPGKNGANVLARSTKTYAARDGGAVTFATLVGFGDVHGMGASTEYMSVRSSDPNPGSNGWATHGITPAQASMTLAGHLFGAEPQYQLMSPNLERGVMRTWSPLTDDPMVAALTNYYVREDVRRAGNGTYSLLTQCPVCVAPFPLGFARTLRTSAVDASEDLSHVIYESRVALVAGASADVANLYEWEQGRLRLAGVLPDGTPAPISQAGHGALNNSRYVTHPMSRDGSRIVFVAPPFAEAPGGAVYMRINARSTVQLNTSERVVPDSAQPARYWDASADGSRVFLTTTEALTEDASIDGNNKLYMWARQAEDEAQSVGVSATGGSFVLSFAGQSTAAVAFDASAVVVEGALEGLASVGAGNVEVSGGPGDAGGSAPYVVRFVGDFSGANVPEMTPDSTGLTGGSASATVSTTSPVENLTFMNVDQSSPMSSSVNGVLGSSDDGRYVYFAATGQVVAGRPSTRGIYLWHEGRVTFIGELTRFAFDSTAMYDGANSGLTIKQTGVSPDGRHLVVSVSSGVGMLSVRGGVDYDHGPGNQTEVYLYSADDDGLVCVSCRSDGVSASASAASRAEVNAGSAQPTKHLSRSLSDDGRFVFFSTGEALVAGDVNGVSDAYVFDTLSGEQRLLSSGTDSAESYFLNTSADGRDAFFVTRERLVGWDKDQSYDLYDARVGGGFPEPPVDETAPCSGDACQGQQGTRPNDLSSPSSSFSGAGNQQVRRQRKTRCSKNQRKVRRNGKARCVRKKGQRANNNRRAGR